MQFTALIAGLGNPGERYAPTRHNLGFWVVDAIIAEAEPKPYRRLRQVTVNKDYVLWSVSLPRVNGDVLLLKPLTYMNLSGRAVMRALKEHGVSPKSLLVLHDELDLPLGRMKFKDGGGGAGHNGIASIIEEVGTDSFARLRLGIGRPPATMGVSEYVLAPFQEHETAIAQAVTTKAKECLPVYFGQGMAAAMRMAHPFNASIPEEKDGTAAADSGAQLPVKP